MWGLAVLGSWSDLLKEVFFKADILTCHSKKCAGVTYKMNPGWTTASSVSVRQSLDLPISFFFFFFVAVQFLNSWNMFSMKMFTCWSDWSLSTITWKPPAGAHTVTERVYCYKSCFSSRSKSSDRIIFIWMYYSVVYNTTSAACCLKQHLKLNRLK